MLPRVVSTRKALARRPRGVVVHCSGVAHWRILVPISPTEVARLAADLDSGLSLPAPWYTDPEILALEHERIFRRSWQYVGRTEQVARVGDYFTASVGDIPIAVVRTERGITALVNVCRHRRHEVVCGAGHGVVLQCPYHAWTYELDGRLRAAPRGDREPRFRKEDYPLLAAKVDTWGPWIFVTPDTGAPPLRDVLGELPELLTRSGLDPSRLELRRREQWERGANWKVMIENFLECYHCPVQHPGFSAVIDVHPDAYTLRTSEWFSTQSGPVRAVPSGKQAPYDARGEVTEAQYHFLWPNFTISINPGLPNLAIDVWNPAGPERTSGFSEHYFGAHVSRQWAEEMIAFNAQVGAEDDRLTDSVQRGLRAGRPIQGRFLVNSERLVVHFQKLVVAALS
ncbi:MAG TPA: aromatic ring-hydroxylating dioxygenase subunit alpha [Candidatus Methylomirabilis sp.]|nr:aromatic ring-hydroxylating dioxygenase subunit alpha [Candidatus Methylomirabilis sp.]